MPREIPAAELPSTPRLNAIMDRAMAKVKALLYELEMDRGKKHDAERAGEVGVRGREGKKRRKNETRKEEGRRGNEKEGRKENKNKNRKRGRVEVIFLLCFHPTYATLTPLRLRATQ